MLDTDIISFVMREKPFEVYDNFHKLNTGTGCISIITKSELLYGAELTESAQRQHDCFAMINLLETKISVLPWDDAAAKIHSQIRAHLKKLGKPTGNFDLMIAAHALSLNAILVTNNVKRYQHIPKLKVENWVAKH